VSRHLAVCAGLVAVLAGCGAAKTADRAAPAGLAPPSIAATCGSASGASVRAIWLHAADGQRLYAVAGGAGDVGIAFIPESPPGNVCGWLPSLAAFERAGFRVLALDYRGTGQSPVSRGVREFAFGRDLAAAVAQLHHDGARSVVLLGASFGAAAAMTFAPRLDVNAVVSLSGEPTLPGYHIDAAAAVPRLRVPLLIVGTRHDSYLSTAAARRLLRRAGSHDKRLVLFRGSWHGWDIIQQAPFAATARTAIISWIRRQTNS
jgi:pimeloyl-ACP methyl ester carboxylesterase